MDKVNTQLDRVLRESKTKSPLTKLADKIPASKAAVSRWRKGIRKMDNETMQRIGKIVNDWFFKYSAARQNYGIISFFKSKRLKGGLFAAVINQQTQEDERKRVQDAAFKSAIVPPEERTNQDWQNIDAFNKEFPEEIASEITELLEWCRDENINPNELIKEFNERLGG